MPTRAEKLRLFFLRSHARWRTACAVLLTVVALARPAQAGRGGASAERQAMEAAKEHLLKGDAAFREGRYDDAMTEFGAGYAAVPRPGFILNMGHVQKKMGNLPRAREYYRQFLAEDPGSKRRAEVQGLIAEIDAALDADSGRGTKAGSEPPPPVTPPPTPAPPMASRTAADDGDKEIPRGLNLSTQDIAQEQDGEARPFYKRWWFWGAVGGVLASGTLAIILASRGGNSGYTESGTWGALGK